MERRSLSFVRRVSTQISVGKGALESLPEHLADGLDAIALIGDENVLALYGERVGRLVEGRARRYGVFGFPPGEKSKTRATKARLEDALLAEKFGRGTCIVALGGGVSLDLGGFVAATYLRGVPCVNVPTSLLAQVDAGLGGKTGVDTEFGKNLVGAFHQPIAVVIDPDLLHTLPPAEWRNGFAEMIKTAAVADVASFSWMEEHRQSLAAGHLEDARPIAACAFAKCAVVGEDERESGKRAILNFGHTVGHAIERATEFRVPHGVAVAMGMAVESRLAVELVGFPKEHADRIDGLMAAVGLSPFPSIPFEAARPFFSADKKNRGDEVRVALPARLGEMARGADGAWTHPVSLSLLEEIYARHLR